MKFEMKKSIKAGVLLAVALLLGGCLKNDIPYATIQAAYLSMTVEHQLSSPTHRYPRSQV